MTQKTLRFAIILAMIFASSLLYAGGGKEKEEIQKDPERISPSTLHSMIEEGKDFLLLDLRKSEDFEGGHISGAVNADMDAAVFGDEEKGRETLQGVLLRETGSKTGEGKTLVLACYTGNRYANAAVNILRKDGRDLSDVLILQGGNKAWKEEYGKKEEVKAEVKMSVGEGAYSWGDTFDFSRKIGNSSLNLYNAMDIMGINTPCAFETSASDVGFAASFADRIIENLGGKENVTEGKDGIYDIVYRNGEKAKAEKRWPKASALSSVVPEITADMGKIAYSVYNDHYLVVALDKMDEEKAREYVALLKKLFPNAMEGTWNDLMYRGSDSQGHTVSFSYSILALALEKSTLK